MIGTGPASVEVILPYFSLRLPARTRTMGECSVARSVVTVRTPVSSLDGENGNNQYFANRVWRGLSKEYETSSVTADRIAAHSTKKIIRLTVGVDRTDPVTVYADTPTVLN